jgi:hypothetical protein
LNLFLKILLVVLFLFTSSANIEYLEAPPIVHRSPDTIDLINSINTTGNSNVISIDSTSDELVGCGIYNGSLQSTSFQSNGDDDIVIFGWTETSGYWFESIGSTSTDFCHKVRLSSNGNILVSGTYQNSITIGNITLQSIGSKDAFIAIFNPTEMVWINSVSIGGAGIDEMRSVIQFPNGSIMGVGSSQSDLKNSTNITNAPNCNKECGFSLLFDSNLNPQWFASAESTLSAVITDVQNVGLTGNTLVIGYYMGDLTLNPSLHSVRSSIGSTDVFVGRINSEGVFSYASVLGGAGLDKARSIEPAGNGFAISAEITSTITTQVSTDWGKVFPIGYGGKDIAILWAGLNGTILDGLLLGSNASDSPGEIDVGMNGEVYTTGYLGSTINISSIHIGVHNTKTAVLLKSSIGIGVQNQLLFGVSTDGGQSTNARGNAVAVNGENDVWFGGRMTPGTSGSSLFGETIIGGYENVGFYSRISQDLDNDSIVDRLDNCINNYNINQSNYDNDSFGDICDNDQDNDQIINIYDDCVFSINIDWNSSNFTDYDGDGCRDVDEDLDDDNDGFEDHMDHCPIGNIIELFNVSAEDRDQDGCQDVDEDLDDDNDGVSDLIDFCTSSNSMLFQLLTWNDYDSDGCHDDEDIDLDNDGISNIIDSCNYGSLNWLANASNDYDNDGCHDLTEDVDDDNDGIYDSSDGYNFSCALSNLNLDPVDFDLDGCFDGEDEDDDNDGILDLDDDCPKGQINWLSDSASDFDIDGCNDMFEDSDDDNDLIVDTKDRCTPNGPLPPANFSGQQSTLESDYDQDGCFDLFEDSDDDNDGILDQNDLCKNGLTNWSSNSHNDPDQDGCSLEEDSDDDGDGVDDLVDSCPWSIQSPSSLNWNSSKYDSNNNGCLDYPFSTEDKEMIEELSIKAEKDELDKQNKMIVVGIFIFIGFLLVAMLMRKSGQNVNIVGEVSGNIVVGKGENVAGSDLINAQDSIISTGSGDLITNDYISKNSIESTRSLNIIEPDVPVLILQISTMDELKLHESSIDDKPSLKIISYKNGMQKTLSEYSHSIFRDHLENGSVLFIIDTNELKQFQKRFHGIDNGDIVCLSVRINLEISNYIDFFQLVGKNNGVVSSYVTDDLLNPVINSPSFNWREFSIPNIQTLVQEDIDNRYSTFSIYDRKRSVEITSHIIKSEELINKSYFRDNFELKAYSELPSSIRVIGDLILKGHATNQLITNSLIIRKNSSGRLFIMPEVTISGHSENLEIISFEDNRFNEIIDTL